MRLTTRRPGVSEFQSPVVRLTARTNMFHYMRGCDGCWWRVYRTGRPNALVGSEDRLPRYILKKYNDGKRQHGPGFGQAATST